MNQQNPKHWLKGVVPACEFLYGIRPEFVTDEMGPHSLTTTKELGCLDAPQKLPAGAVQRFVTDEGAFGWPHQLVSWR